MTSRAWPASSDGRGQVVEAPGRVQGVDPGPELGGAEVGGAGHLDQAGPGRLLVAGRHPVLQVGQQHVDLGGHVGDLGHHLGVRGREEVDHPRRAHRDLADRLGRAHGQRSEEVLGVAHRTSDERRVRKSPDLAAAVDGICSRCAAGRRRKLDSSRSGPVGRPWNGYATHGGTTKQQRRRVPPRAAGGLRLCPPGAPDLRGVGARRLALRRHRGGRHRRARPGHPGRDPARLRPRRRRRHGHRRGRGPGRHRRDPGGVDRVAPLLRGHDPVPRPGPMAASHHRRLPRRPPDLSPEPPDRSAAGPHRQRRAGRHRGAEPLPVHPRGAGPGRVRADQPGPGGHLDGGAVAAVLPDPRLC